MASTLRSVSKLATMANVKAVMYKLILLNAVKSGNIKTSPREPFLK